MMKGRHRFAPTGAVAIAPAAFGLFFEALEQPGAEMRDGVSVLPIRGPLMHHQDWWCDSYEAIRARVDTALSAKPKALVLAIDSPGGLVSGCFETADAIRDACARAGVPLVAFVDGQATSAAYALACAAERIVVPSTGIVGSIGVIEAMVDVTAQDAAFGVRVELVTSGARKADGHPHIQMSPEAVATTQARVSELAEIFFARVATSRRIGADAVRAMQAGIVTGASAVGAGLADEVATLDQLLARLASGAVEPTTGETMSDYQDALAKLRKAAEGDDEEAADAKKMLAALDESGEEDKPAEEPKDEAKANAHTRVAGALAGSMSTLERNVAELMAQAETAKKEALFASRPDLAKAVVKELADLPFAQAKALVDVIPRTSVKPAASAVVPATRGDKQGSPVIADPMAAQMAEAMGTSTAAVGVVDQGNRLVFGGRIG